MLLEAAGAAAGAGSLDALFLQIAGCTLAISAAVEYCLTVRVCWVYAFPSGHCMFPFAKCCQQGHCV